MRLNFRSLTLMLTLYATALGSLAGQRPEPHPPARLDTPQEVLLLFSGNSTSERILLTLNNNRNGALVTSVQAVTVGGQIFHLSDVTMVAGESKQIELSPLLGAAGLGSEKPGWIKLTYNGVSLEMGAQLTLYPVQGGSGVDSPRSLVGDYKSKRRTASFWLPNRGYATLSLVNASDVDIQVHTECDGRQEDLKIAPRQTANRKVEQKLISLAGSHAVSCDMQFDGPLASLRPVGTVIGADGYAAPVRFYDPATATFQNLTSVGLRTADRTVGTIYNTSDDMVTFTPVIREATLSNQVTKRLPSILLRPHQVGLLPLDAMLRIFSNDNITLVTLTLETTSAKGSIIGSITQTDRNGIVEDIPLRTSNPPAFARGSYPLRWDEDYTNLVTIANTADRQLKFGASITAGDMVYVLKREDLDPGATLVVDIDQLKRNHTPDVNGNVLPDDAKYGKFHWIEMGMGKNAGLLGRQSLASITNKRRSSFSCGSTCYLSYDGQPFFDLFDPFTRIPFDGHVFTGVYEYVAQTNGINYHYPITWNSLWAVTDGIVNYSNPQNGVLLMEAGTKGMTDAYYLQYLNQPYYVPDQEQCFDNYSSPEVHGTEATTDQTPILTGIDPDVWNSGTTTQVTFTGSYFGTNPPTLNFSSGVTGYSLISYSDDQIVAYVTTAIESDDTEVTVSVTNNGYGGAGFVSGGGTVSGTSTAVHATIRAPLNSPRVTVIGWVDASAPDVANLPTGANSQLVTAVNNFDGSVGLSCIDLLTDWVQLSRPTLISTQADRDYANSWLILHSANAAPPSTINPDTQYAAGDYRLFNSYGGTQSAKVKVGKTPNPCAAQVGSFITWITSGLTEGQPHPDYMGKSGYTGSGNVYLISEGRVGSMGQKGNSTINQRSTPWIYSVISFNSSGTPQTVVHTTFPTFYVYWDGVLHDVYTQSTVHDFIYNYDAGNQSSWNPLP